MTLSTDACCSPERLREFAHGEIADDGELASIAEHLANCPECTRRFDAIEALPIVALLKTVIADRTQTHVADEQARAFGDSPPPPALLHHPKWKPLRRLGQGGMGVVYLARHRHLKELNGEYQFRALKIVHESLATGEKHKERFLNELRAVIGLPAHPHIVQGFDVDVDSLDSFLLLVMEYVPGDDLEHFAAAQPGGRLPVDTACGLILQALSGLDHARRHGVVAHRDLKPENLIRSEQGIVKVVDFGLAKIRVPEVDPTYPTQRGLQGCGSAKYSAPEQMNDFAAADTRSDLYSLGCTLYRLLAGHPPFGVHNGCHGVLELLTAHQAKVPPSLRTLIPHVPAEVSRIVDRLLDKNPDQRFQTPLELATALFPHASPEAQTLTQAWIGKPQPEELSQPKKVARRKPRWFRPMIASGCAALLLFAVIIFLQNDKVTVQIKVDDPTAVVKVEGTTATIDRRGFGQMRLSVGERSYTVTQGDTTVVTEGKYVVRKGERNVIEIVLNPLKPGDGVAGTVPNHAPAPAKTPPTERDYYQKNRVAAQRALDLGGGVTVYTMNHPELLTLKAGDPLPAGPLIVREWQLKESRSATGKDLEVLAGLRHLWSVNPARIPTGLESSDIGRLAAISSPLQGLSIGHTSLRTSDLNRLPTWPYLQVLWLTTDQVDDDWKFLWRFPTLRWVHLHHGAGTLPDLRPLGDYPQLRRLHVTTREKLDPLVIAELQRRNPHLSIQWGSEINEQLLGHDPARAAVQRLVEAGIRLSAHDHQHELHQQLTAENVAEFVPANAYWYCEEVPPGVALDEELRALLTDVDLHQFTAKNQPHADELAAVLANRHSLYALWLSGSDLTDTGLSALQNLAALASLDVTGTRVTAEGVAAFHRAVPACGVASDHGEILPDFLALPPPPAAAPFDAKQARAHQEAWAEHLGVPVEWENSIGMKFVLIPPGEFMMGSTDEELKSVVAEVRSLKQPGENRFVEWLQSEIPQHQVRLTHPYYLAVHELTQALYAKVIGKNPSHHSATGNGRKSVAGMETTNFPVDSVSWDEAIAFCNRMSQQDRLNAVYRTTPADVTWIEGNGYRLPTEAEWEFAARAGTTSKFWCGDRDADLVRSEWITDNSGNLPHPVGQLKPNPFGLYDILGNQMEWVFDASNLESYERFRDQAAVNPTGPDPQNAARIWRGGAWGNNSYAARPAMRSHSDGQLFAGGGLGFRLAISVDGIRRLQSRTPGGPRDASK